MKNSAPTKFIYSVLFIVLISMLLRLSDDVQPVKALSDLYIEDFTATLFKDELNTNVTGWGDGSIRLPNKNPILVGSSDLPDVARGVFISGDYAYIVSDDGTFHVVDISSPTTPVLMGSCQTSQTGARRLYVVGNYAYVTVGGGLPIPGGGIDVVQISDPANPIVVSTYNTSVNPTDVFVKGNFVYIADTYGDAGLKILNATDPAILTLAGSYANDSSQAAPGVKVRMNYAFLAHGNLGLQVVDVSDPTNPTYAGSCEYSGQMGAVSIDIAGNYAYVVDYYIGLVVMDISDPTNPIYISNYQALTGFTEITNLAVQGKIAYIPHWDGLESVDVTNSSNVFTTGTYKSPGTPHGIFVDGRYAFLTYWNPNSGLQIIEVLEPIPPNPVSSYDTPDFANGIFINGGYAYLTDNTGGFHIIDINDPRNITYVNTFIAYVVDVSIQGNYAYLAAMQNGLYIVDISDPMNLNFISSYDTFNYAYDVFVSGDYAYIADEAGGLQIVNITDPTNPLNASAYNIPGDVYEVFVTGNYAYVTEIPDRVQIVNISDPTNPTNASAITVIGGTPSAAYMVGNFVYISNPYGVLIVDIGDPTNPLIVGETNFSPGVVRDIFVHEDYAYLAYEDWGLQKVNISDPSKPTNVSMTRTPGRTMAVFLDGNYAFIADGEAGLQILKVKEDKSRLYSTRGIAQSNIISSGSISILSAMLQVDDAVVNNTAIEYFISTIADGTNWEQVTPGLEHTFANQGHQLKWKAILTSSHVLRTPEIISLSIDYFHILRAPSLESPNDGEVINNFAPTFSWESVSGASEYLIQLDTSMTAASSNLINETTPDSSFTPWAPLAEGTWYWRVAAIDSEGDLGVFSATRSITLGTSTTPAISPFVAVDSVLIAILFALVLFKRRGG